MYDVLIIGAGPAGISAALYAKRANLNVAVVYKGESQLDKAHKIDNYYGFPNGITGSDLYQAGIEQAKNLGVDVFETEVTHIEMLAPSPKSVYGISTSTSDFQTTALIIATGNKKLRPPISGIQEFEGKGVSYCAVCDGFFYRKKSVCVLGNKLYAFEEASHLANMASSVTILTDGKDCSELKNLVNSDSKMTIDERKVASIQGDSHVQKVVFEDGSSIDADGFFVALGSAGGADFAKKLGLELEGDSIKVDEKMQTNAPGIFSCGNVTGGLLQVCKAVYEGGVAGLSAVDYVRQAKKA